MLYYNYQIKGGYSIASLFIIGTYIFYLLLKELVEG